jgi:hypothetical protein
MKKLLIALAAVMITAASYGQGQVVFANKVGTALDAPVTVLGSSPLRGPGPGYTAQLHVQAAGGGALTPLTPTTTFRAAGTGAAAVADRYWINQDVVTTGIAPGAEGTLVVLAWETAAGTYDAAKNSTTWGWGASEPFKVTVGGGTLPPANLSTLQAFSVQVVPEPSVIALGILGAAALMFRRRKK